VVAFLFIQSSSQKYFNTDFTIIKINNNNNNYYEDILIYVNACREEKYNMIITTYSKLVGLAKNKNVYGTIHFKGVFLDEGHWIKNSSGK
jgi:SNF2 family DNA or RNA helicase